MRLEDQDKIRSKLQANNAMPVPETKGKRGKKRAAETSAVQSTTALKDFGVEYSKSSRAECVGCQLKIMKEDVRVKKTVFDTEVGMKFGGQALWHHLTCFAQLRHEYDFYVGGELLPGFSELSPEDKKEVKKALP